MSQPNFLDKLLAEVEWCRLEKVVKIKHGKDWKDLNAGNIPVYGSGGIMGYVDQYSYDKPTVLIPRKGSITNIFFVETPFWNVDTIYYTEIDTSKVLPKYLYHYVKTIDLMALDTGSGRPSLTQAILNQIPIPIPCPENPKKSLEVQREIVRILDAFTELTTELTAELASELTARKKQYNYYRDQLLSFEQGKVEWKTLGEVTLPTNNIRWSDTDHSYRYIDLTSVSRENNLITETSKITARNAPSRAQKLVEKDDVIFATTRPTQQRLCLINDEYAGEVASTGYCVLRAKVDEILPKWIYYCISSIEFKIYVQENQSGSAYPAISDAKVKEFKLPIPPLAEQERIVDILDKFDALTSSISEGLPREIELRQKQYEYYRELLLSFPKAEVGPT
ncbi:restriction endonuclease subunit S [Leptospira interrogans]|uniref:restriction endonuclease subunit S n=1 Tax=Leptospira interrogans TaxID=173 RepID=UPI00077468BE|nr:restriction endonuclease subunit S [Leptospira interrogans]